MGACGWRQRATLRLDKQGEAIVASCVGGTHCWQACTACKEGTIGRLGWKKEVNTACIIFVRAVTALVVFGMDFYLTLLFYIAFEGISIPPLFYSC